MLQAAVAGLVSGGAYALLGVCVVLLYRMVGVLNIGLAAIGCFGVYTLLVANQAGVPLGLALILGFAASAAVSALLGVVMSRWFSEADVNTRSSATIAMLIGLLAIGFRLFGDDPRPFPPLFGTFSVEVAGVIVPGTALAALVSAAALAFGIGLFLRSRPGVRLRALSERPTTAELLGIPAFRLSVGTWAVAGVIAMLAVVLIAPTRSTNFLSLSLLILPALGAALLGSFRSFPATLAGGLLIGVVESVASLLGPIAPYRQGVSFVLIVLALVWLQRREVWDAGR